MLCKQPILIVCKCLNNNCKRCSKIKSWIFRLHHCEFRMLGTPYLSSPTRVRDLWPEVHKLRLPLLCFCPEVRPQVSDLALQFQGIPIFQNSCPGQPKVHWAYQSSVHTCLSFPVLGTAAPTLSKVWIWAYTGDCWEHLVIHMYAGTRQGFCLRTLLWISNLNIEWMNHWKSFPVLRRKHRVTDFIFSFPFWDIKWPWRLFSLVIPTFKLTSFHYISLFLNSLKICPYKQGFLPLAKWNQNSLLLGILKTFVCWNKNVTLSSIRTEKREKIISEFDISVSKSKNLNIDSVIVTSW